MIARDNARDLVPDGPPLFWIAAAVGAAPDGNPPAEVVPLRGA